MLDNQSKIELGIKTNNWYLFTKWKKKFKENNPKLLEGRNSEERKRIYRSALKKEGIPVH